MAFAIQNSAIGGAISSGYWDGLPGNRFKLADVTVANGTLLSFSSVVTFAAPVQMVRAYVWQKSFSAGISTVVTPNVNGPQYQLQVADSNGFTTNVRSVDIESGPRTPGSIILCGPVPDNFLAQWARISVLQGVSIDSLTYDVVIDAA